MVYKIISIRKSEFDDAAVYLCQSHFKIITSIVMKR